MDLIPPYVAAKERYANAPYRYSGHSGLQLPLISLGLWHNFGGDAPQSTMRALLTYAFDHGITHFDLANNYGPPYGAAECNFGALFKRDFLPYRDELIISTKAGFDMWEGPYGNFGSRKYLIASLNQSLKRMGLEYVDIFYHHRPDPHTPLEETMEALSDIVRQGKALYVGLSNYDGERLRKAQALLKENHTPCIICQNRYSIFDRTVEENGLLAAAPEVGCGIIAFSPLAQGLLTDRYLNGIAPDTRVMKDGRFLKEESVKEHYDAIRALNGMALDRSQTLAQMALAWLLSKQSITSVLMGASKVSQLADALGALEHLDFDAEELKRIDCLSGFNHA
ncbi:MAG TPA: aldo/keto reductase [Candidatus Avisuccinivibrio pullicola]|nr:aldo/keto reductase [Candidatus Avisuccinivibrio pullicola]